MPLALECVVVHGRPLVGRDRDFGELLDGGAVLDHVPPGRHRVLGDQRRAVGRLELHCAAGAHRGRRRAHSTLDVGARGRSVRQQRDVDLADRDGRGGVPRHDLPRRPADVGRIDPASAAGPDTRSPRPAAAASRARRNPRCRPWSARRRRSPGARTGPSAPWPSCRVPARNRTGRRPRWRRGSLAYVMVITPITPLTNRWNDRSQSATVCVCRDRCGMRCGATAWCCAWRC